MRKLLYLSAASFLWMIPIALVGKALSYASRDLAVGMAAVAVGVAILGNLLYLGLLIFGSWERGDYLRSGLVWFVSLVALGVFFGLIT